jgi:hypothetical protein
MAQTGSCISIREALMKAVPHVDGSTRFDLCIGVDYSGAQTAQAVLPGLQVYVATVDATKQGVGEAVAVAPPDGRRGWSRQSIAEWLIAVVESGKRFLAGIDHGFSFPDCYFSRYQLRDWDHFLEDFVRHWPTHRPGVTVDDFRKGNASGVARTGPNHARRLTECWTSSAKSVFHFDVQGSVAKSTHAGIPWLHELRQRYGSSLHFWPFDGWEIAEGKSVLAEVYPSVLRNRYPRDGRTVDQQDAYATARWLQTAEQHGFLDRYFSPPLIPAERQLATREGWILGVV